MRPCIFILGFLVSLSAAQGQLSLKFVGDYVTAISADGSVAVGGAGSQGFRYTLASSAYQPLSFAASDVNATGSVVVGINSSNRHINRWENGVTADLSSLPNPANTVVQAAYTNTLAGAASVSGGAAFLSNGTTTIPIPDATNTEVFGISGDGSAVVGFALAGPFLFKDGTLTTLNELNYVTGISLDGSTILGRAGSDAAYLDSSGLHLIPGPPETPSSGGGALLHAISANNSILAGEVPFGPDTGAFFWTQQTGSRLLEDLIAAPEGWFLARVTDMSADGSVMVGQAWNLDGSVSQGFIVSGISTFTPVPEPATVGSIAGLLLMGFVGLSRRRRPVPSIS